MLIVRNQGTNYKSLPCMCVACAHSVSHSEAVLVPVTRVLITFRTTSLRRLTFERGALALEYLGAARLHVRLDQRDKAAQE